MNTTIVSRRALIATAWVAMLLVSDLPDILIVWLGGTIASWLFWAKGGYLVVFYGFTLLWKAVRALWQYALVLLVLFLSLGLTGLFRGSDWFQGYFNYSGVPFFTGYFAVMVLDILVALAVIAVLWLMKKDRKAFFMAKGQMDAPIEPIRWLGIKAGENWKVFGWIFACVAGLAVFILPFFLPPPPGQPS